MDVDQRDNTIAVGGSASCIKNDCLLYILAPYDYNTQTLSETTTNPVYKLYHGQTKTTQPKW
jgi:hypothetical protein